MVSEQEMLEVLGRIEADIPGFIGASVVDVESGMTLAIRATRFDFDLADASAFNSEIVKLKLETIRALKIQSTLEDVLLTLSDQIHLIKMISPSTFIYLAADRANSNLGMVHSAVTRQIGSLI